MELQRNVLRKTIAGLFGILLTLPLASAATANDDYDAAAPLAAPGVTTGSTVGATLQPDEPLGCYTSIGSTIWYQFTPVLGAGTVTIDAEGTTFWHGVGVFTRQGNVFTSLACDSRDFDGTPAVVTFQALPATTYYVQVGGFVGGEGAVVLTTTWSGVTVEPDSDGDRIPDAVEAEICGRALVRNTVNSQSPTLGTCIGTNDYVAPETSRSFEVPTAAFPGEDHDGDGVPSAIILRWTTVTIDPLGPEVIKLGESRDEPLGADPDDSDPNNPVDYAFIEGLLVMIEDLVGGGLDMVDMDRDGVPDAAEPAICDVENQNSPGDGTCVGADYQPPF